MEYIDMTSLVGQTLGNKYQLERIVGAGGMAQVYRAIQKPLDRSVAVKVLHPHLTRKGTFAERFLREAKAIAALQHPNIVQIFDFESVNGTCYMAMEFLDGMSLEDQLRQRIDLEDNAQPLPLTEALEIVIRVSEALDFAHRQGVIHRDVKPANIMRTKDGRIVLTDFGIATLLHETRLTVEGTTSGTPSYMSPEQALGERGDERSDIYSLGAVLYQLVTGQLPFEADTMYGLIMQHINEPPPPPSEVNPQLPVSVERVILKAMEKNPGDRYRTASEFAADLHSVLRLEIGEASSDLVTKPMMELPRAAAASLSNRRAKVGWLAFAVALLGVLILARVLTMPSTAESQPALPTSTEVVDSMAAKPSPEGVESMTADKPKDGVESMAAGGSRLPLSEDFDSNVLGWVVSDGPISRQLVEGAYQVTVTEPNKAIAAYPEHGSQYDNFTYEAEATLLEGQPESGYGLVFRRQDDENYYVFAINGLRQWSVWRLEDRVWHELRELPNAETWTFAEAVSAPGEVNQLRVETYVSEFALYVNGQLLATVNDKTFASGGIGFYVASSRSSDNALARIDFDNVSLTPFDGVEVPPIISDDVQ